MLCNRISILMILTLKIISSSCDSQLKQIRVHTTSEGLKRVLLRLQIDNLIMLLNQALRKVCKTTSKRVVSPSHTGLRVQAENELVTLWINDLFGQIKVRKSVHRARQ